MKGENQAAVFTKLLLVALLVVILAVFWFSYNSLVKKEEHVFSAWAQVESNLQRKADMLPALVDAIKVYMGHEKDVLLETSKLRSHSLPNLVREMDAQSRVLKEATSGSTTPDESAMHQIAAAKTQLDQTLKGIFAVAEQYPVLKSSEQFLRLQAQIEGTENRINVTRMQFNNSVDSYNSVLKTIPTVIIARIGGFQRKAYFKADKERKTIKW